MAAEPQLGSNNPFRGKTAIGEVAPIPSSASLFDEIFATEPARKQLETALAEPPAEPSVVEPPAKRKVVKKVRVQSPPPSSPDTGPNTPADEARGRGLEGAESSDSSDEEGDPFESAGIDDEDDEADATDAAPVTPLNRPPPNPFSKTLHDLERGSPLSAEVQASPQPKPHLDVDAFRQLLLTGRTGGGAPQAQVSTASHASLLPLRDETSTDASSISRHSLLEPPNDHSAPTSSTTDTPRTSHEIEPDAGQLGRSENTTPVPQKKKPPPPSSRHGKLIKIELKEQQRRSPVSPSDVNKPLPPAPIRKPVDEETTSIFDQESVGKIPEPSPPAAPAAASSLSKKPMPTPPPRRQRSESKPVSSSAASTSHEDETPRRSSSESTRSKTDSARLSYFAPAPPPPRRPHTATAGVGVRLMSSFASPSAGGHHPFVSASTSPSIASSDNERSPGLRLHHASSARSLDGPPAAHVANVKLGPPPPPPPPPARNPSTRRPLSAGSMESLTTRRLSTGAAREREPAPPPPPRRQRGSSRGSVESVDGPRVIIPGTPVVEEPLREVDEGSVKDGPAAEPGHGEDILADLDALQREVHALQERYSRVGGRGG
jgi:hypothetical protein